MRSLLLQPGHLRSTLSGTLSSRLVHSRFQLRTDSSLCGSESYHIQDLEAMSILLT